jgi:hypothetical protein
LNEKLTMDGRTHERWTDGRTDVGRQDNKLTEQYDMLWEQNNILREQDNMLWEQYCFFSHGLNQPPTKHYVVPSR